MLRCAAAAKCARHGDSTLKRTLVVITVLSTLGGLAAAGWWYATDLSRLAIPELVDRATWRLPGGQEVARVTEELRRRPQAELLVAAPALLRDQQASRRLASVHVLGVLLYDESLGRGERSRCQACLADLLQDADALVRSAALCQLAWSWVEDRDLVVPPAAVAAVRELLSVPDVGARYGAAFASHQLSRFIAAEAPAIVAALAVESDAGIRMLLVSALRGSRPGDVTVSTALLAALDDPDAMVRGAAADSLGEVGVVEAVPALQRVITRENEPDHVRRSALRALARLVATEADAEAVLPAALALRTSYEFGLCQWVYDVGCLACRVPRHQLAADAEAAITAAGAADLLSSGTVAAMRLQLAAARGATSFAADQVQSLQAAVRELRDELAAEHPFLDLTWNATLIEACIDLLRHPTAGVDRAALVLVLDHLEATGSRWDREWAAQQRSRLP